MKKYRPGKTFRYLASAIKWIENGHPVYWRHKFMAAGFIIHWPLIQIRNSVNHGSLKKALLKAQTIKQSKKTHDNFWDPEELRRRSAETLRNSGGIGPMMSIM